MWWIHIWRTEFKMIELGISRNPPSGCNGVFFTRTKALGPFYVAVYKPTIGWVRRDSKMEPRK